MQEPWVQCLGQKTPWSSKWISTPVFLPGKFHGHRSLAGYGPWGCKEQDTTERAHMHTPLEILISGEGAGVNLHDNLTLDFPDNLPQLVSPQTSNIFFFL